MIEEKQIINIQNFLDYQDFFLLRDYSKNVNWKYTSRSSNTMPEWHLNNTVHSSGEYPIEDYNKLEPVFRIVLNKLSKQYNCFIKPYDIYFNAYKFGNEMEIHTDKTTKDGLNRTIIVYLTDDWQPSWHGETVFYDDKCQHIIKSVVPYPNSVAIFDGRIPHSSVPISKFCLENRIILVYQCEIEKF